MNARPMRMALLLALALALAEGCRPRRRARENRLIQYVVPSITAQNWPTPLPNRPRVLGPRRSLVNTVQIHPSTLIAAVIGGSSQIALGDASALVLADDKGSDVVAIGSEGTIACRTSYGGALRRARQGSEGSDDLRGHSGSKPYVRDEPSSRKPASIRIRTSTSLLGGGRAEQRLRRTSGRRG